jgi:allantoate deiminase
MSVSTRSAATSLHKARASRLVERCRELARISDVPNETTRLFLSAATHKAQGLLTHWMRDAGLRTRIDDAGSLRGFRPADPTRPTQDAPTLLLFSHIDTVPNAGAFDGLLGIMVGLSVVEELGSRSLPYNIELIAFAEEEGVRFGFPFLSSLAATGGLTEAQLALKDTDGVTVADALRNFGLDPERIARTCPVPAGSFAGLEVHIEQGPVLDSANEALGVVEGVIGQSRLRFTFEGQANHAGTTPMALRHDALVAAARWIVDLERYASEGEQLVATVGHVEVMPGAGNVVPGRVHATLDVRHPLDKVRREAVEVITSAAVAAAAPLGVRVESSLSAEQVSVPMDSGLTRALQAAAKRAGYSARTMFSGAGHDAMILAPHLPTTMLFVRSPCGLSHHPQETVREEDVEAAIATVLAFLDDLRP